MSTQGYIDNNNFVRIIKVEDSRNRFSFRSKEIEMTYYDYVQRAKWTGVPIRSTRNFSRPIDNYQSVNEENVTYYFGAYFFASEEMVHHSRVVRRVIDVLGQIGGIFGILAALFGVVAK